MKQNNALASKKIVVNNLLCFVQNNLRVLSPASICRLCDETYMPEEVNQAFNNLKLQVQTFDPLINVQPSDNSKLGILNAIVELFNGKVNTEVQFVSNNCNLPRMNSYRDMLSVTCVLDEIRELKQIIKEQNKHLTTAFCRLSNQFELFKLKQQSSQANHKGISNLLLLVMIRISNTYLTLSYKFRRLIIVPRLDGDQFAEFYESFLFWYCLVVIPKHFF